MYRYIFTFSIRRIFTFFIFLVLVLQGVMGQNEQKGDSVIAGMASGQEAIRTSSIETEKDTKLFSTLIYAHGGLLEWQHSNSAVALEPFVIYGGGLAFNFRVVRWLEVSAGAGLSLEKAEASVENYSGSMMATDNEGDSYERRVAATQVEETQNCMWVEFPLLVRCFYSPGRWDLFAEAGAEYRMPVISTYDQTGSFTHQGYYEQYDLLVDDLLSSGYYTDFIKTHEEKDLEIDNLLMPFVGIGLIFPGRTSHFFFEARYYMPGEDPFTEKHEVLFPGSEKNERPAFFHNSSVMSNGEVTLSGLKGIIGIRF